MKSLNSYTHSFSIQLNIQICFDTLNNNAISMKKLGKARWNGGSTNFSLVSALADSKNHRSTERVMHTFPAIKVAKKQNPSELCRTNSLPLWPSAGIHNGAQQIVHFPSRVCIFHRHHKVKCCPEDGLVLQFGDPQQTKQSKPCFGRPEMQRC